MQAFNNVVWTDPSLFSFSWNNFSAFIGVGGSNIMAKGWGADTLQGGVGDGWTSTANPFAYQNASNLAPHVTGFADSDITALASVPFRRISWTLRAPEPAMSTVPSGICDMPTRFAYLPDRGYAVPRIASPNVGATDTTTQTDAILAQPAQSILQTR